MLRIGEIGISREVYDVKSGMVFLVAAQEHYAPGVTTLLTKYVVGVRPRRGRERPGRGLSVRAERKVRQQQLSKQ